MMASILPHRYTSVHRLLSLIIVWALLIQPLTISTVNAAQPGVADRQGVARSSSTADLKHPAGMKAVPAATTLAVSILSTPYATHDSNSNADPSVWVVAAVITNTGAEIAANPIVTVTGLTQSASNPNWFLLPGELDRRNLKPLAPGASQVVYWFAHRSNIVPDPHTYTVTVSATNAPGVSQSQNAYGNPSPGSTIQTREAINTGNNGVVSTAANVVVGVAFTMSVDYDMGTNPSGVTVQPNGTYIRNGSTVFDPSYYRLLSNVVQFRSNSGPVGPQYQDRMYFAPGTLPTNSRFVNTTYTFVALKPGNASLCPYTDVLYNATNKYDNGYCAGGAIINITGTLSFSLTKSVNAATVREGEYLTYTLFYTNTGSLPVSNVYLWDHVPAQAITTSVSPATDPTPGFNTADRVVWNIGDVAAGASGAVTLTVLVNGRGADLIDGTPIVNNGFMGIFFDPQVENPAVTSTVTTTLQAPGITIGKTDDQTTVIQGQILTYTLNVTNAGTVNATNLVITDVLPSGVSYTGGAVPAPTSVSGQTLVWDVPALAGGGTVYTISLPVQVAYHLPNGWVLTNTMQAQYSNTAGYTFTGLSTPDVDTVLSPILSIRKSDFPDPVISGRNITYTVFITNSGSATATNVVVTDSLPFSTTFVACGGAGCGINVSNVISWLIPSIAPSTTTSVTLSVKVNTGLVSGSSIVNQNYGVVSDQTLFVAGPPEITTVFNAVAIINGRAFNDANGNGILDGGETGIAGVSLFLPGALQPVTVTNASGVYTFALEVGGPISVSAGLPAGFFRTTPSPVFLNAILEQTRTVNFGYAPITSTFGVIFGTVYDDANHDGAQGLGESGLMTVSVASTGAASTPVTTNQYGQYTLNYPTPGNYTVNETNPAFYVSTTPDSVSSSVVSGASSQIDFGDFLGIRLQGQVFNDVNVNAANDTEPGLAGVLVTTGNDAMTTNATGVYTLFVSIASNTPITLTANDLPGYVSTAANPGSAALTRVDLNTLLLTAPVSGTVYANNDFGDVLNTDIVTITGQIFNDANADGLYNDGGSGLANGRVTASSGMFITTTSSGAFTLYGPANTTITVTETNPAGYLSTNALPGNQAARYDLDTLLVSPLLTGTTSANNYFGDILATNAAIISGTLFNDLDRDGVFDGGETTFTGQTVTISGTVSQITATNTSGTYVFAVGTGMFVVRSSVPAGYYRTTPASLVVSTTIGNTYSNRNFGFSNDPNSAAIYGIVFNDYNGNGLQDIGELGIPNAIVRLITGTTTVVTYTTDSSGLYTFNITQPGVWQVRETNPSGYFSTSPDQINVAVTLGNSYEVNFGDSNRTDVGSVHGLVFDDVNANGIQDTQEVGLAGVVITTTGDGDIGVVSATTGLGGQYSYGFDFVSMGNHTIYEIDPVGYRSTTPNAVVVFVQLGQAQVVNFGDCQIGVCSPLILGTVFDDNNGDGNQDFSELGIPGVTITLYDGATPLTSTLTGPNGNYLFGNLSTGNYRVVETDPNFYHSTTPNDVHIAITANDTYVVNFGDSNNPFVSSIFGTVFNDTNANAVFDFIEVGLPNVSVNITGNQIGVLTTNSLGQYTFQVDTIVPSPVFTATETDLAGYVSTTPNEVTQTVALNQSYLINFGDVLASTVFTITGVVWDDTASPNGIRTTEPGLSGVSLTVNTGMSTLTNGSGAYVLYALGTAGTVTVTETNLPGYLSTGAVAGSGVTVITPDVLRFTGLSAGGASTGNDFGDALISQVITVTGHVFNDLNANRVDDSEPGLAGVSVVQPGGTSLTEANGDFSFFAVPGTFIITQTNLVGFVSTVAITGSPEATLIDEDHISITAAGGATVSGIKFGDYAGGPGNPGGIRMEGLVFNDLDSTGTNNGDPGIEGVILTATFGTTATTDTDGQFVLFAPSNLGPITITEETPLGYASIVAIAGVGGVVIDTDRVQISAPISGTTYTGTQFGDQSGRIRIEGWVFRDVNANGLDDDGQRVSGAIIQATDGTITTTNASGVFVVFAPSDIGPVTLTETDPLGYVSTVATAPVTSTITVLNSNQLYIASPVTGTTYSGALFGDYNGTGGGGVMITGTVFDDANASGTWEVGESGTAGAVVTATHSPAGALTVADGLFTLFAPSDAGAITILESGPVGYVPTGATAGSATVSVLNPSMLAIPVPVSGTVYADNAFGLLPPACAADTYEGMNDNLFSTTSVALGNGMTHSHGFHVYNDKDWTQVTLTQGETYTFTTSAVGARSDTLLTLFASDGVTILAENDDYSGATDFSSRIVWAAQATGTYYLRVVQSTPVLGGCDTQYTLSMTNIPQQWLYLPLVMR